MKKTFKFFAIAAAMIAFAACNNTPAEQADTTAVDTVAVEEEPAVDTVAVEAAPVEEPVATAAKKTTKKPAAKAEEPKVEEPTVVKEETKTVTTESGLTAKGSKKGKMQKKN